MREEIRSRAQSVSTETGLPDVVVGRFFKPHLRPHAASIILNFWSLSRARALEIVRLVAASVNFRLLLFLRGLWFRLDLKDVGYGFVEFQRREG